MGRVYQILRKTTISLLNLQADVGRGRGVEFSTLHKVGVFAIILNSQTRMALNERGEMPERSNGAAC